MEASPEHDPKQGSYKEKAAIKWNVNDLLGWIGEERPNLLCDVKRKKLRKADVTGEVFLGYAGNVEFFRDTCKLPPGTSFILAKLAKELAEGETAVIESKLLSFMSCTSRRQQANSVTGNRRRSSPLQYRPSEYPEICPRQQTVQRLAELLDQNKVMHVRGTPASGKSTLARLLCELLIEKKQKVVFISRWDSSISAIAYLKEMCQQQGYLEGRQLDILTLDIVFVIDDAQQTYVHSDLWYDVIKTQSKRPTGPRFCLFSSYGCPITGSTNYPFKTPPVVLARSQRVSLIVTCNSDAPDICLFYNDAEYEDVLRRFYKHEFNYFTLDADAERYLFELTSGHPGAVNSILLYIRKV